MIVAIVLVVIQDSSEKLHKIAMREVKMLKEMKHENIVHLKEAF